VVFGSEPEADTESATVIVEATAIEEQVSFTVRVIAVAPSTAYANREAVHGVVVPVRSEVNVPLEIRAVVTDEPLAVDPTRDVETIEAIETTIMATVVTVVPVRATVVVLAMFVEALVMPVDLAPIAVTVMR